MGSTKSQNFNPTTTRQVSRPQAPSSVWTRMLVTGYIIGSLFTPTAIEAGGRKSNKKQDKPVSASRAFIFDGIRRIQTITTKDSWNYIFESWNNHPNTRKLDIANLVKGLGGVFTNRQIDVGISDCETYIVTGKGKQTFGLVFTGFFTTSGGNTIFRFFDTEVPVQNTKINLEQSVETCTWTARFSRNGKPLHVLRFSNSGDLIEDRKLTAKK